MSCSFFTTIGLYIIRFISLINFIFWVALSLKVLSKLLIKKRKSIGKRGDFCGILVAIIMGGLWYPLKTNKVSF